MVTVKDMIRCPKCGKQMMGKAYPQTFGKEYYAHCCHLYFGVSELVNQWNYDAADLFAKIDFISRSNPMWKKAYSEFDGGEPYWTTEHERVDAYEIVNRMFINVPELDDYIDMLNTYEDALGIGVQ